MKPTSARTRRIKTARTENIEPETGTVKITTLLKYGIGIAMLIIGIYELIKWVTSPPPV